MQPITHCLNKQLLEICQQASVLEDLNRKINGLLPENIREHCTVGSFKKGCLVLVLSETTFATELRYFLPTLRDSLRKNAGLHQLVSIKVEIMADLYPKDKAVGDTVVKPQLSANAQESIKAAADLCSYEPLKEVLQRLGSGRES